MALYSIFSSEIFLVFCWQFIIYTSLNSLTLPQQALHIATLRPNHWPQFSSSDPPFIPLGSRSNIYSGVSPFLHLNYAQLISNSHKKKWTTYYLSLDSTLKCLIIIINCKLDHFHSLKGLPGEPARFLGWADPLEEGKATQSSILPGESQWQRSLASYSPLGHWRLTLVLDFTNGKK